MAEAATPAAAGDAERTWRTKPVRSTEAKRRRHAKGKRKRRLRAAGYAGSSGQDAAFSCSGETTGGRGDDGDGVGGWGDDEMRRILPPPQDRKGRHTDFDGVAYTFGEFESYYGRQDAPTMWGLTHPAPAATRPRACSTQPPCKNCGREDKASRWCNCNGIINGICIRCRQKAHKCRCPPWRPWPSPRPVERPGRLRTGPTHPPPTSRGGAAWRSNAAALTRGVGHEIAGDGGNKNSPRRRDGGETAVEEV